MDRLAAMMKNLEWPADSWVFTSTQPDLHEQLRIQLQEYFEVVLEQPGRYLYAEGDIPVLLVAHLDTAHLQAPDLIMYDEQNQRVWSPDGLGADDRAGVWGILALLRSGVTPHVLFTWDQVKGRLGAKAAAAELHPQVKFIVEMDRPGQKEAVYYHSRNRTFERYIGTFGFVKTEGTFSDICELCPVWDVAGVNFSAGYYEPQTIKERLHVRELARTLVRVREMLELVPPDKFTYAPDHIVAGNEKEIEWVNIADEE